VDPGPRGGQTSVGRARLRGHLIFITVVLVLCLVGWLGWDVLWRFNPLDLGDPLPESVMLQNATATRIRIWQNVEGYTSPVADLAPGESRVVSWIFWEDPSYRAEDLSGKTIYCGPAAPGAQTHFGAGRQLQAAVAITRESAIVIAHRGSGLLCEPPR
jgi:hypothetical protein